MPKNQSLSTKTARRAEPSRGPEDLPVDFPIVGIGASAGGLDACKKLVSALPAKTGMAFILIQHLDPTHESMMVDLLAGHTPMTVLQATDGMAIEREHLYVIPPGTYLSVANGMLHVSHPRPATVRACRSTFCCTLWPPIGVPPPSAWCFPDRVPTAVWD